MVIIKPLSMSVNYNSMKFYLLMDVAVIERCMFQFQVDAINLPTVCSMATLYWWHMLHVVIINHHQS